MKVKKNPIKYKKKLKQIVSSKWHFLYMYAVEKAVGTLACRLVFPQHFLFSQLPLVFLSLKRNIVIQVFCFLKIGCDCNHMVFIEILKGRCFVSLQQFGSRKKGPDLHQNNKWSHKIKFVIFTTQRCLIHLDKLGRDILVCC